MATLPRAVAERLQQGLDPQTRAVVGQWMQQIDDIDPLERKRALEVFHSRIKLSGTATPSSPPTSSALRGEAGHSVTRASLDRSAASEITAEQPASVANAEQPASVANADQPTSVVAAQPRDEASPLSFMNGLPAQSLATLLAIESSQTVAIVLSKLRPNIAAEVLPGLPDDLRLQTLRRLATLGKVADDVVVEVANHFRSSIERPRRDSTKPVSSGTSGVLEAIMAEVPLAVRQRWQRQRSPGQSLSSPGQSLSSPGHSLEHSFGPVASNDSRSPMNRAFAERWIEPTALAPRPQKPVSQMDADELQRFAIDRALADPSAAMLEGDPRKGSDLEPSESMKPVPRVNSSDAELRRRLRITLQSQSEDVVVDSVRQSASRSTESGRPDAADIEPTEGPSRSTIQIHRPDVSDGSGDAPSASETVTIESLNERFVEASAASICRALGKVPTHTAIFSLCGMPPRVVADVLGKLPRKKAKEVRRRIENVHDLSLREIEGSMREVASVMAEFHAEDPSRTASQADDHSVAASIAAATSSYVAAA